MARNRMHDVHMRKRGRYSDPPPRLNIHLLIGAGDRAYGHFTASESPVERRTKEAGGPD